MHADTESTFRPFKAGRWLALLLTCLLPACAGYDVSVNDRLIYTPKALLTDITVADPALQTCIEQSIEDQKILRKQQLLQLNCASAGIRSLDGIEQFDKLEALKLSDNRISDIDALHLLPQLRVLLLAGNSISDPRSLATLQQLETLDLAGNNGMDCDLLAQLQRLQTRIAVTAPAHCSG